MEKKKIYILLTRLPNTAAPIIEAMTGSYYTHTSIGLEEDMNTFYSFGFKGFVAEKITQRVRPDKTPFPCQLYELEVPSGVYASIKDIIARFQARSEELHYSHFGVVMCLLRIPFRRKNHYFCSQFVAEVLKKSEATRLRKYTSLYVAQDFKRLPGMKLAFHGNLLSMLLCFRLAALP